MQRVDLGVFGSVEIVNVVALNGLVEERQPQQEDQRDDGEGPAYHGTGLPGSSGQTSVPGRSRSKSTSCSGRPVRTGKRPEVQRDDAAHIQHPARERRFARTHGVEVADGQERELGMIQALDQLHIGEDVGIARAIDARRSGKRITYPAASPP